MSTIASVDVILRARATQFNREMKHSQKSVRGLSSSLGGLGTQLRYFAVAIGSAVLVGGVMKLIQAASAMEEVSSKFEAVFKEQTAAAEAWAIDYAAAVGRSTTETKKFLSSMQDTFVPLGFARDNARLLSQEVVKLAVDLGSFNDTLDADSLRDLQSALVGNHETMRKYGVIITQISLDQKLLSMGFRKSTQGATEQQKVMARLQIMMASTTDAQGDAIRTAGSYANQLKGLKGAISDAAVVLGEGLLPAATQVVNLLKDYGVPILRDWAKGWTDQARGIDVMEGLAESMAFITDVARVFQLAWYAAKAALATFIQVGVLGYSLLAKAINWVLGLFGEQNEELRIIGELAKVIGEEAHKAAEKVGELWTQESGAERVKKAFDEIRKKLDAAGNAADQFGGKGVDALNSIQLAADTAVDMKPIIAKIDKIQEKLRREISIGAGWFTKMDWQLFDMEKLGANLPIDEQQKFNELLQQTKILMEDLKTVETWKTQQEEFESNLKAMMAEGASIFEQTRTPIEAYGAAIENLNKLLNVGAIDWDTYGRAIKDANEQLGDQVGGPVGGGTFQTIRTEYVDVAGLNMTLELDPVVNQITRSNEILANIDRNTRVANIATGIS